MPDDSGHNEGDIERTRVLNLYAGIGGNRKLWSDVDVTAVEWDEDKAEVYRDHFPGDTVVIADAHEYLKEHHNEFNFIWASPPCPTHSRMRKNSNPNAEQVYPDMRLYQEIIFLQGYFGGDWVVENVEPWYDPLIEPQIRGRHAFWSNFHIPQFTKNSNNDITTHGNGEGQGKGGCYELAEKYGFELRGYDHTTHFLRKIVSNCVRPELGKHVFDSRRNSLEQQTLVTATNSGNSHDVVPDTDRSEGRR
jgi:DNA (cytosine-5)-methyltransferase 1